MVRSSGFLKLIAFATIGISTIIFAFAQPAFADELRAEQVSSEYTPHIQSALAELAEAGGRPGACFNEGSVEKCATCCREFMTACIDLVVPLCLQGDPDRSEFRHCLKNKEDRCKSDFHNCAWLCRRAK
ncbi:hypothetical protein MNBD_NITROSPINAE05-1229 [hydrothermal vent metagenome]|uniref:Uncharacterized protein n=1 Tax=hydrothermal vent metagenome TaxID=652676 RepID=A0A3B1CQW3_9ZZZZ